MSFNVALPSEDLEARKADLSLKRKGASSSVRARGNSATEGGVQFNAQWHQLATRVEASSVHRSDNSSAGEDVLEGVGEEVNSEEAVVASAGMRARLGQMSGKGSALPESARAFFEPRLGVNLSQVRLHTGAEAASTARELDAQAFTAGRDIFFAAGQYRPDASEGKRLLAHELAHVARQGESVGSVARLIHGKPQNPLQGHKPSEVVDYRGESVIDDGLQQSSLWKYIGSKFEHGTRVGSGGGVKYIPRKDFETAAAGQIRAGEDVKTVGGFYDRDKDTIVLPERPLLESMLHETIHKFADSSFKAAFGPGLNEAGTQYFTNFVLQEFKLSRGTG